MPPPDPSPTPQPPDWDALLREFIRTTAGPYIWVRNPDGSGTLTGKVA